MINNLAKKMGVIFKKRLKTTYNKITSDLTMHNKIIT